MPRRILVTATLTGIVAGALTATLMAFLDWRGNPAGLFHDESGTNWTIVRATWISWFAPVTASVAALSLPLLYWLAKRR